MTTATMAPGLPLTMQDRADLAWTGLESRGWRLEVERGMAEIGPEVWFAYAPDYDAEPLASLVRLDPSAIEVTMQDHRRAGFGRPVVVPSMRLALRLVETGLPDLP